MSDDVCEVAYLCKYAGDKEECKKCEEERKKYLEGKE